MSDSPGGAGARVLWVDPGNGAAGDMLLAALLDAGAGIDAVRAGLGRLAVEPIGLELRPVRRHGFRAAHLTVTAPGGHEHRDLAAVTAIIAGAGLPGPVARFATDAFRRLARAEARVHASSLAEVHFHEVGALDAIADVVGCALALHDLDLLDAGTRVVGPVAVGSGVVRTAHGPLPVPAPAVLELLTAAGAPIAAHPAGMELCTPTGAALLATLATGWGPPPGCTPTAVGVGAGSADPSGHPNVLRALVGWEHPAPAGWTETTLCRIDATIDDLDPRIWPDLLERLRAVGAADAWCTPATMRKGRPGQVLSVLVGEAQLDLVCDLVFEQTPTLGLRVSAVRRRSLRRDQIEVPIGDAVVRVKRGYLGGRVVTVQPEYDDVAALARKTGTPVRQLLADLDRAARPDPA